LTTPAERREEFFEDCIEADETPGAVRIDTPAEQRQNAERHWHQADYHGSAAESNLAGGTDLMAFREGYYVMLHKADQALALAGFDSKTHHCTLMGIRGVFNAPDLADELRRARAERSNVDYAINPTNPQLEEFEEPRAFLQNTVSSFIDAVDEVIEDELELDVTDWDDGPSVG
jgi:uncharacterized protein (UPF0332 family)